MPDDVVHLARIRAKVQEELRSIPDYVCVADVERLMSGRGQKSLRKVDTLQFEIANSGGRELYALPGDSSFRDGSLTDSVKGGLVTTGDFSAHAREIFAGSFTQVQFAGSERLEGIDALKWSFRVPKFASTWTLLIGRAADIPESVGYFWADPVSDDVLRFEVRAAQLPPGFPARDIVRRVDYSRVTVGDRNAWLPRSSEFSLIDNYDRRIRNVTRYSDCRQFTAKSNIRFVPTPP